ncbi:MAG: adenylate/guanylate cyclase domain-containing protein [Leptospiraceae bacterium]|nr:adenylate/guanylate cyclase domain-containing protein [Leptospiraceae bacterium]
MHILRIPLLGLLVFITLACSPPPSLQSADRLDGTQDTLFLLERNWRFYNGQFCSGPDCTVPATQDVPLLFPGTDADPRFGTYVFEVHLSEDWLSSDLGIQFFDVGSAYRLLINGKPVGETGHPGPSSIDSTPETRPSYFQFPPAQDLTIAVQWSNFAHPRGGIRGVPRFGAADAVLKDREASILRNLIAMGIILGMGFYHIGLFLTRRSDRASLAFALFCLCWSVRMLFTGEVMIRLLFPNMGYEFQTDLEYISFILAGPLFVVFLGLTFPFRGWRWLAYTELGLGLLSTAIIIPLPVIAYARFLWAFQAVTLISVILAIVIWAIALKNRKPGALASLIGGLIASATAVNDVLFFQRISPIGPLFHYGLLIFILAQSYLLARLFASTYEGVKRLSENLKNTNVALARFVPTEILKVLNRTDITEVRLGDQSQERMTVMFSDIRSFTTLSEQMSPPENFNFLNSYLRRMTPIVNVQGGFVDKYIGDAVMALFPSDPDSALRAAVDMQREIRVYNKHRATKGYEPISIGIGIHTGDIMLGIIGHENRMEGTVISDTVNTASRVERLTRRYGVMIVVSDETVTSLQNKEEFQYRTLGIVRVKGRRNSLRVHHLLNGYTEDVKKLYLDTRDQFNDGVEEALKGNYDAASENFRAVLDVNPMDAAARFYIERMADAGLVASR